MKRFLILLIVILCIGCSKKTIEISKSNNVSQDQSSNSVKKGLDGLVLLKDDNSTGMRGLYFFYDKQNFTENDAVKLIKDIRNQYPFTCNINIIDDKSILDKMDDFDLEGTDYCYVADHFICWSSFDCPTEAWYYPYQDSLYEQYGGKNKK